MRDVCCVQARRLQVTGCKQVHVAAREGKRQQWRWCADHFFDFYTNFFFKKIKTHKTQRLDKFVEQLNKQKGCLGVVKEKHKTKKHQAALFFCTLGQEGCTIIFGINDAIIFDYHAMNQRNPFLLSSSCSLLVKDNILDLLPLPIFISTTGSAILYHHHAVSLLPASSATSKKDKKKDKDFSTLDDDNHNHPYYGKYLRSVGYCIFVYATTR